ncbi:MAG: GTPase Era [Acidimicrobiales bacterium]
MPDGFLLVALLGRPNVGKSTLVNAIAGRKVSITSSRPSTTRRPQHAGVVIGGMEVVFVDTPGMHRPKSELGKRMAQYAEDSLDDADVIMPVFDASRPATQGDRIVMARALRELLPYTRRHCALRIAVNKIDRVGKAGTAHALAAYYALIGTAADAIGAASGASGIWERDIEIFPVSALEGIGVREMVEFLVHTSHAKRTSSAGSTEHSVSWRQPYPLRSDLTVPLDSAQHSPAHSPFSQPATSHSPAAAFQQWDDLRDSAQDVSQEYYVAELVREQVLQRVSDELPYSVACRITEWHPPYIACDIVVERKSQKAIILGKGGTRLRDIGMGARSSLPAGTYLDLTVKVVPHWQDTPDMFEQMGY